MQYLAWFAIVNFSLTAEYYPQPVELYVFTVHPCYGPDGGPYIASSDNAKTKKTQKKEKQKWS